MTAWWAMTRTCWKIWSPPPFNDAVRKVERTMQEKMGGLTSGMGLPPGMLGDFKMPF
jgi:hypothetical protein